MAATGNVIGKVASVHGEAFAKGPDGAMHQLKVGDPVFEGEVIQTGAGGHVELAFRDGTAYFVRESEAVTLDGMVFGGDAAEAGNIIGKVASIQGEAFAKEANGVMHQLKVGDPVFEGEMIQTPPGGRVELAFNNGAVYFVRDKESVTLDSMVFGGQTADAREAALMPGQGVGLDDISRAIAEGSSFDRLLEETSAGRTAAFGSANDGHSFVQLLRIVEAIDPAGYQFGSRDGGRLGDVIGVDVEAAGGSAGLGRGNEAIPQRSVSASVSINTVAGNDIVNAAEAAGSITVSGSVAGDAKAGDTVTLTIEIGRAHV